MKWIPYEDRVRKKYLPNTISQTPINPNDYIESTTISIDDNNHGFN